MPDDGLLNPTGVAQSQPKRTEVTLPEGVTINAAAGEGLTPCTPADYARETATSAPGEGCPKRYLSARSRAFVLSEIVYVNTPGYGPAWYV